MCEFVIDIKHILEIIFKTTKKSARFFSDSYLCKDVSILSKWKSKKTVPRSDDLSKVVEFTMQEANSSQRIVIRNKIEDLIKNSYLEENIRNNLLIKDNFEEFLSETLSVSIMEKTWIMPLRHCKTN